MWFEYLHQCRFVMYFLKMTKLSSLNTIFRDVRSKFYLFAFSLNGALSSTWLGSTLLKFCPWLWLPSTSVGEQPVSIHDSWGSFGVLMAACKNIDIHCCWLKILIDIFLDAFWLHELYLDIKSLVQTFSILKKLIRSKWLIPSCRVMNTNYDSWK